MDLSIFKNAVESSINAIGITDLEGKLIYVNDSCVKMWGYNSKDEVLGSFLPEFWEGDGVLKTVKELREKGVASGEDIGKRKDGSLFFVRFTASIFTDEADNPSFMFGSFFDITERKQAEEELRKSEERFKMIFTNSSDGIIVADPETKKFLYVNPAICKILGYTEEELTQMGVTDIHPKNQLEHVAAEFEAQARGEKLLAMNIPFLKKNGKIIYMDTNASIVRMGKKTGLMGVFRDITDRKLAEGLLRESRERFRNLTEMTSDWIWEVDKNGFYTYVSPKIQDMLGYKPEEIIGETPFDLMPPAEAKRVSKNFNTIVASREPFDCLENINLHKNGHPVVLETSGIPTFDADGAFRGYRGIDRDITKRKQVEKALSESEERYRSLAENSMVGFWQITLEGYTTYINPAMCSMIEIEGPEELSGQTYHSFFSSESLEMMDHERTTRPKGRGSSYEAEIIGKNGGRRNAMICGAPLLNAEGELQGYIATFTDITDRKRAEKALKKAHDKLERRVKERTRELEIKTNGLEEINTAMTVLLKKREGDKIELEDLSLIHI